MIEEAPRAYHAAISVRDRTPDLEAIADQGAARLEALVPHSRIVHSCTSLAWPDGRRPPSCGEVTAADNRE
jgi:hypothetical protein